MYNKNAYMFYAENLYNWKKLFKNKCKIVSYNFYEYKIYVVLYIYISYFIIL